MSPHPTPIVCYQAKNAVKYYRKCAILNVGHKSKYLKPEEFDLHDAV
jgi:hypothetical protein